MTTSTTDQPTDLPADIDALDSWAVDQIRRYTHVGITHAQDMALRAEHARALARQLAELVTAELGAGIRLADLAEPDGDGPRAAQLVGARTAKVLARLAGLLADVEDALIVARERQLVHADDLLQQARDCGVHVDVDEPAESAPAT